MNEVKSKGFVVKKIQTQEADLVVKIIAQNGEKITAYARSALKSRRRFEGGLPLFTQVDFRISKKHAQELYNLEETKITYEFKNLAATIESLTMASYIAEVSELCAQEGLENPALYNLFGASLKALDNGANPWVISPQFDAKLLSLMGWMPDFSNLDIKAGDVLKAILSQKISPEAIAPSQAKIVEGLLKNFLRSHLGDGKIKSLDFFGALRSFQEKDVVANPKERANNEKHTNH